MESHCDNATPLKKRHENGISGNDDQVALTFRTFPDDNASSSVPRFQRSTVEESKWLAVPFVKQYENQSEKDDLNESSSSMQLKARRHVPNWAKSR